MPRVRGPEMTMKTLMLAGALCATLAAAPAAFADPPSGEAATRFEATTLDLSAHAEVNVPPDMARITLGVTTDAATAADAMHANAGEMAKVVAALKAGG